MVFYVVNLEGNPAIHFSDMFLRSLPRQGDEWKVCNLAHGEQLPTDLLTCEGVVLTGSSYNCRDHAQLGWFEPLCEFVRLAADRGMPRIYASCFACQLTAVALGGVVDRNPSGQFILKVEQLQFTAAEQGPEQGPEQDTVMSAETKRGFSFGLKILESHGDCVVTLPTTARLLATSATCSTEIFAVGRNILACQSHPEFDVAYAEEELVWMEEHHRMSQEEVKEARRSLGTHSEGDAKAMLMWISDFLHL